MRARTAAAGCGRDMIPVLAHRRTPRRRPHSTITREQPWLIRTLSVIDLGDPSAG